ncbi:response regulator [Schlesneria paludicola]|uniref:response regulator n=1 Tax=Schlesneria paludicola TaxID=360056 RepID=UPI00029A3DCD|nr:response regulator [Schlesneria paludicola]
MRVLVAEDDAVTSFMLVYCLEQFGYEVTAVDNGLKALELVRTGEFQLVISDWSMPKMTGVELCRQIRKRPSSSYTYVILLTSHEGTNSVVEGLDAGADDFITKPFQPEELQVRLRTGERVLSLESRDVTIFALAKLAESRDFETGAHLDRIREYCRVLCEHLLDHGPYVDQIDGDFVRMVYLTSPLHDIGKVGIPDKILLKPGKLTDEEFEVMKQHAQIGSETLDAALQARPDAEYLRMARDIARSHHEKFDGTGYPLGLKGNDIPMCGRIVALADVYDALTTKRIYKSAFSHEKAREIILDGSGKHFDPAIVDAFVETEEKFVAIRRRFADYDATIATESVTAPSQSNLGSVGRVATPFEYLAPAMN